MDEHRAKYHSPVDGFDVLIYTGSGLMGREITSIRSCDMVVIAGGRTGTLGELAIAYVLYDDDPPRLIDRLIHYYRTEHHRKPSCFCESKEG